MDACTGVHPHRHIWAAPVGPQGSVRQSPIDRKKKEGGRVAITQNSAQVEEKVRITKLIMGTQPSTQNDIMF